METYSDVEKHCSVILDEMTIGPSEEYIPQLDKFVGKVDMGGIVDPTDPNQLATKMLGYILVGLNTYYKIPVAYFLVYQLTAKQQEALTLQVIKDVEGCGFKITRLVSDNLAVNTTMFKRMNDGDLFPVIRHPQQEYSEADLLLKPWVYRPLFCSFDYCHVTKNVRNQLLERNFHIKGERVTGDFAVRLFAEQTGELLTAVRSWTPKHVMPNNIEKQKVKAAMDMFRPAVTAAIEMHAALGTDGFVNVGSTVRFMKRLHRWISLHDVSSVKEQQRYRLPDKMPYYSPLDERLHFLESDFNPQLHEWHQEIENLIKSMPDNNQSDKAAIKKTKKKFLTHETYEALTYTTTSTVACIRYLLEELDFKYVLTRRFSSDPVEQLFGAIRQLIGGNFKGDATAVSQAFEKILRTGIAYNSIYGNTTLSRESEKEYKLIRYSEKSKIEMVKALRLLPPSSLLILNDLQKPPAKPKPTSQACTAALLSGYIIRVLLEQEFCGDCVARLQDVKSTDPLMQLIFRLGCYLLSITKI
ncbi:Uncharacterized protein APZ42_026709 [Daphnia magna]|uniref:THAP domain-containing protein n=1 Tax=Daphnia magna TaxID=35525 RepID=A0A164S125_9CRUS|nr:Uncharacterized protein APZ42_026709 [Daphnia magna]